MTEELKKYFASVNIEYFSVLDYSECRVTSQRIIDRESFTPASVIIYLLPYYTGETVNISRYAASLDYHIIIKEIGEGLISFLKEKFPSSSARSYGDHSPIDERHAALIGGLGIAGDNGLIINEKYGSYVFVGDIITDISPDILGASAPRVISCCRHCGACLKNCPTGILRGEGVDCLSAITQRKGELSAEECSLMREYNTAWGCDLCQSACPYNRSPILTPIEFFRKERIPHLTREVLDSMSDDEFSMRAFAWRKRKTVERNLEILAKNDVNDN